MKHKHNWKTLKLSKEMKEYLADIKKKLEEYFNPKETKTILVVIKTGYWCGIKDGIIMERNR